MAIYNSLSNKGPQAGEVDTKIQDVSVDEINVLKDSAMKSTDEDSVFKDINLTDKDSSTKS